MTEMTHLPDRFQEVLRRPEFSSKPPVLVDIGASGWLSQRWAALAPFSICIALDADSREFSTASRSETGAPYRSLYLFDSLVTDRQSGECDFFLTRSPYCSSTLEPRSDVLRDWACAGEFEVVDRKKLPSCRPSSLLAQAGVDWIDWFKTDSQGIDVRLFRSLGQELVDGVLMAEFEPGIVDAYKGEDKFVDLLRYMQDRPFWMSSCTIHGSQRIGRRLADAHLPGASSDMSGYLRSSPGWVNCAWLNTFPAKRFGMREYLLGWIFACLEEQFGFATELADRGYSEFSDRLFLDLRQEAVDAMNERHRLMSKRTKGAPIGRAMRRFGELLEAEGLRFALVRAFQALMRKTRKRKDSPS